MSSNEEKVGQVLDNSYVRLVTVVAVVGAAIVATVGFTEMRVSMEDAIEDLQSLTSKHELAVKNLNATMNTQSDIQKTVERLDKKIVGKGPNGWHRPDQKQFCRETELKNTDLNWKCGSTEYDGAP